MDQLKEKRKDIRKNIDQNKTGTSSFHKRRIKSIEVDNDTSIFITQKVPTFLKPTISSQKVSPNLSPNRNLLQTRVNNWKI